MTSVTGRRLAGSGEAILHFLLSMEYMGMNSFFRSDCWEPRNQEGSPQVRLLVSGGGKVTVLHTVTCIVSSNDNIPGRLCLLSSFSR